MKPETRKLFDFKSLSTDEMKALIQELTEEYAERLDREKRRKAEEYAYKISDLISKAQQDDLNVMIANTYIPRYAAVEVYI